MTEFARQRLSILASIVTGSTPSATQPDSWGDYLDFITPSDQKDGNREAYPARRLSRVGAARLRKRIVPAGSTNLTCIGSTIGKVSLASGDAVTNQQINSIVAREGTSDPIFLYYMISNWSGELRQHASGSATPIINKSVLSDYEFHIPELHEQRAIAEVLGALDDKITANTKLIAVSEKLSESLFGSMLDGDARSIPLSESAQFVNGKAFTKNASGTGRVVIRIAELNSGIGGSTVYNDIDVEDQYLAEPGSILFAWSGSLTLHRWFRTEGIVNQHIFKVIPAVGFPRWLVFELLRRKLDEFKSIAADKATTMGHIQRKHLDDPVLMPSMAAITEHDLLMETLWKRSLNVEIENETLAATRDVLLPQLMSGKLRVKDAESLVAAAV